MKACSTFTKGPLLSDIAFLGVLPLSDERLARRSSLLELIA